MGEDNFFSLSFYINEARRKIYFYGLFLHTDVWKTFIGVFLNVPN